MVLLTFSNYYLNERLKIDLAKEKNISRKLG